MQLCVLELLQSTHSICLKALYQVSLVLLDFHTIFNYFKFTGVFMKYLLFCQIPLYRLCRYVRNILFWKQLVQYFFTVYEE